MPLLPELEPQGEPLSPEFLQALAALRAQYRAIHDRLDSAGPRQQPSPAEAVTVAVLGTFHHAERRAARLVVSGANDEDLLEHIGRELGISGGKFLGAAEVWHAGGERAHVSIGREGRKIQGKELLRIVREELGIGWPTQG